MVHIKLAPKRGLRLRRPNPSLANESESESALRVLSVKLKLSEAFLVSATAVADQRPPQCPVGGPCGPGSTSTSKLIRQAADLRPGVTRVTQCDVPSVLCPSIAQSTTSLYWR